MNHKSDSDKKAEITTTPFWPKARGGVFNEKHSALPSPLGDKFISQKQNSCIRLGDVRLNKLYRQKSFMPTGANCRQELNQCRFRCCHNRLWRSVSASSLFRRNCRTSPVRTCKDAAIFLEQSTKPVIALATADRGSVFRASETRCHSSMQAKPE